VDVGPEESLRQNRDLMRGRLPPVIVVCGTWSKFIDDLRTIRFGVSGLTKFSVEANTARSETFAQSSSRAEN
jgi:hypothetical protein